MTDSLSAAALGLATLDFAMLDLAMLGFARPEGGWALLLGPLFLVLLRMRARPPEVVIGTLELWDEEPRTATRGTRTRARIPPWAHACALGLFLGALAWLGPRPPRAGDARRWTVVVDLSPSMHLASGAGTRLDAALASAGAWLARAAARGDHVRWLAPGREELVLGPGLRPGADWFLPRPTDEPEPGWGLHDQAGTLWITDRAPAEPRARAGLFASGGAAVEGPIAADGHETVVWERGGLRLVPTEGAPALLVRAAPDLDLPAVLERVLVAWSEARGFELVRAPRPGTRLVLELAPESGDAPLELGRDGWSATGRGGLPAADAGDDEEWLAGSDATGGARAVVRARRGLVRVGLRALSEPAGDAARFALSWAQLLDRCLAPPAGVVSLAERAAAGDPRAEPGAPPPPGAGGAAWPGPELDAGLALGAGVCALLALRLLARS